LDIENQGAERLVKALEWAERVARVWRIHGGGGISELQEASELVQLSEAKLHKGERQDPTGSVSSRPRPSSSAPNVLRTTRPPSTISPSTLSVPRVQTPPSRPSKPRRASQFLPPPDPAQRGFDVLVNFLPATGIPDGYLLKNAILVTTISRPFVIATALEDPTRKKMRSLSSRESKRGSKWSLFRQSSQKATSLPMTPLSASSSSIGLVGQRTPSLAPSNTAPSIASSRYPTSMFTASSTLHQTFSNTNPALVIHVLPSPPPHPHNYVYTHKQLAARNKLVASIDSFLCAFGASQASFMPSIGKSQYRTQGTLRGDDKRAFAMGAIPRARPYIVDGNSFANDVINATGDRDGEWSLAELLCCACLDPNPPPAGANDGKREHRTWISGISDIIISSSSASGSVGDMTPRSLTPEDDSPRNSFHPRLVQQDPSSTGSQNTIPHPPHVPNGRPPPVPQHQPQSNPQPMQQHHSSPSPSPPFAQQPGQAHQPPPSGGPTSNPFINGDSASFDTSSSSHGPSGMTSPVPPTPPEKDYYQRGWETFGQIQSAGVEQGLPATTSIPISNGNAYSDPHPHLPPQSKMPYAYIPNENEDEGVYPRPMDVAPSMPPPPVPISVSESGTLNARPPNGESGAGYITHSRARAMSTQNGVMSIGHQPPSNPEGSHTVGKKKSLRWKFWK
jgi:hypothetical protein